MGNCATSQTIVLANGKGGVGKTSVAVNLGIQLAQRGVRAALLDADHRVANVEVLARESSCGTGVPAGDWLETAHGLRIAATPADWRRPPNSWEAYAKGCADIVDRLRRNCDTLLIDCGSGMTESTAAFALCADQFILVTTPEPPAITDAYRTLKQAHGRGFCAAVGVIVNMARNAADAVAVVRRLQRTAGEFLGLDVQAYGHIPRDSHVTRAVRQRVPVAAQYPRCRASRCIASICDQLVPRPRPVLPRAHLWGRVASLVL